MSIVKIFVASHKPDKVYEDNVYTPIHVGRAISKYKEEMANMIGDDTGDNISEKNQSYCELTATYWVWKTVKNADYAGLAHYRRYFETKFSNDNVDQIMNGYDVMLVKPYLNDIYMRNKLRTVLTMEDEAILFSVIKKIYPECEKSFIDYLYGFRDIPCNMFVMRRDKFESYCEFLFSILFECDKYMRPLPYTNSMRRMGFIGEFLTPIFCLHNNLKIKFEPIVSMVGEKAVCVSEFKQKVKIHILHKIYDKHKPHTIDDMIDHAIVTGMKNDGIVI